MNTIKSFPTGSTFILNSKRCRVTKSFRVNVYYTVEHTESRENDTYHIAKRSVLEDFVTIGLIQKES